MTERFPERFPYEQSRWHNNDPDRQKRWLAALERTGPEQVKTRLAQEPGISVGAIAIGDETEVSRGFVEEWLRWHDHRKAEREANFRQDQIFWTRWAVIAASVAALAAAISWAFTIHGK